METQNRRGFDMARPSARFEGTQSVVVEGVVMAVLGACVCPLPLWLWLWLPPSMPPAARMGRDGDTHPTRPAPQRTHVHTHVTHTEWVDAYDGVHPLYDIGSGYGVRAPSVSLYACMHAHVHTHTYTDGDRHPLTLVPPHNPSISPHTHHTNHQHQQTNFFAALERRPDAQLWAVDMEQRHLDYTKCVKQTALCW